MTSILISDDASKTITTTWVCLSSPGPSKAQTSTSQGLYSVVRVTPTDNAEPRRRPLSKHRARLEASQQGRETLARARVEAAAIMDSVAGLALINLRMSKGLSQVELAELSGIRQPHLSRIECGKVANPDRETVSKIAAALHVSVVEVEAALAATLQSAGATDA